MTTQKQQERDIEKCEEMLTPSTIEWSIAPKYAKALRRLLDRVKSLEMQNPELVLEIKIRDNLLSEYQNRLAAALKLADELEAEARVAVPPEYATRNMHEKYLKLDVEAAGLDYAAERLRTILQPSAQEEGE